MTSEKLVSDAQGPSTENSRALQPTEDENAKNCWVCFATEADDRLAAWVQPCKCIGTTKWVCYLLVIHKYKLLFVVNAFK